VFGVNQTISNDPLEVSLLLLEVTSEPLVLTHYEKLCPQQLNYPTTRAPKQLIYNYIVTIPWKYDKLINKMPHQKIKELYCSSKLVTRCIFIHYNVHIVYTIVINHV
jgi:hypothetical protein